MNQSFLVDVNLPKYFSFFNHENYQFVCDLNLEMSDSEIWNLAIDNNLIILTKDVDFFTRFLVSSETPKIIHFQLGNLSLKELYNYFDKNWNRIQNEIETNRMIIVKSTHIECFK